MNCDVEKIAILVTGILVSRGVQLTASIDQDLHQKNKYIRIAKKYKKKFEK